MSRTAPTTERNAADQQPMLEHALDAARSLTESASREAGQLGDEARRWFVGTRREAARAATLARKQARAVGTQTRRYIRDEPVKSTLLAAAGGALLAGLAVLVATRGRH